MSLLYHWLKHFSMSKSIMIKSLLVLMTITSAFGVQGYQPACYIRLNLQSCQHFGARQVVIRITPYGPLRIYEINGDTNSLVCHPMKCTNGKSSTDVSIIAMASTDTDFFDITTQPMGFTKHHMFYTSEESCYLGSSDDVTVQCPMVQARFYSLSDGSFSLECETNQAVYPVSYQPNNGREAQQWEFQCKASVELSHSSCHWLEKVNSWETNTFYQCPLNHVITGVKTYYNSENEHQHFQFKCCSNPNYSTHSCELSDSNDYSAVEGVFVGALISDKDSRNKDWNFLSCKYDRNSF